MRGVDGSRQSALAIAALVGWVVTLVVITLTPGPPVPSRLAVCLICGSRGSADAVLNGLLFVPLGFALGPLGWGLRGAIYAGGALSLFVEALQHFLPGRYSNLGDILWNAAGSGIGSSLWLTRRRWLTPSARGAGWLATAAVFGVGAVTLAFGALLEPQGTPSEYWGQWTAELGNLGRYDGSLLAVRLADLPMPSGPFPVNHDPRAALEGNWTLSALVVKGTPPARLSPIVSVYDEDEREILLLGAEGEDLVVRERMRAGALRFDQPDLSFENALASLAVGDTFRVEVRRRGGDRCLRLEGEERCVAYSPGRSWSLLVYPEGFVPGTRAFVDGAWVLLLLLPVGFWSRSIRGLSSRMVLGAILVILVPATLTDLGTGHALEWSGLVAGSLAGFCAWRMLDVGPMRHD